MPDSTKPARPPQTQLLNLLAGSWIAQGISVAATLGVADLVKDRPKTADVLARATGTHARSLYRLMRMLASVGVFVEDGEKRFGLTPLASCLLSDAPGSQRALAIMLGEEHFRTWADLLYSIQTGKPAFDKVYGKPVFDYLASTPRSAKLFDEAMVGVHGAETAAMIDAYDFTAFGVLVDVGGGNGSLITAILKACQSLKGVLFDQGHVIERAKPALQASGVASRCQAIAGSFFESVPPGGDAYLMRHIIHDWDEERCALILGNCRKVMGRHAKLLIAEMVIPPGNEPFFGKQLDLNMLVIPGGMERTEAEYRDLLGASGFRMTRVVPTRGDISIVEAVPAE